MADNGVTLGSGQFAPAVAFGTWDLNEKQAPDAVAGAIQDGYRWIDTAQRYHNEVGVGEGIRRSRVAREELMVTSKLRGGDQGSFMCGLALQSSLANLGLEYLDVYMIHWPLPRLDLYVKSFKKMMKLRDQGLIRTLGVSNFTAEYIDRLADECGEMPAINQVELHIGWNQDELRAQMAERGVAVQAWSPLSRGTGLLGDERLVRIADELGVSAGQVGLRWLWEKGVLSAPKASSPEHRRQNLDIFSFALTDEQTAALDAFEPKPIGADPKTYEEF